MTAESMPDLVCSEALRRTATGWTLLGSRCLSCGELFFPVRNNCARCCGTELQACELGDQGTLWSWTIQGFMPKSPYNGGGGALAFKPYGVGYVELPSGLKVETRLTVSDPAQLHIGMPMRLTLDPYRTTTDGPGVFTFAFKPSAAGAAGASQ